MEMPGYETLSTDTHHKQQAFLAAQRASPSAQKVLTLCMSLAVRAAGPLAATQGKRSWLFPLKLLSSKICYIAGPDAQPATLSSDNADLQARWTQHADSICSLIFLLALILQQTAAMFKVLASVLPPPHNAMGESTC